MPFCCYCGATLLEGARFCHICGKEADLKPHCPKCGSILPEGSRFCGFCGTSLEQTVAPQPAMPQQPAHPMQQPVMAPASAPFSPMQSAPQTIKIPAPEPKPQPARGPVPLPDNAPLSGISVPAVVNPHSFTGSVQRFYGEGGSFYTFQGTGMYGFLEPYSMNYTPGQGPIVKTGGKWFYHISASSQAVEIPELEGAQIITSTPDGMYVYIAPTIYFVSPDGAMRPFIEADETLTDMICYQDWLFVTYLGPFEELPHEMGGTMCCDRSYVVAYDRFTGDPASIFERCAGIFYIDKRIVILCDLMDNGEIRRNVYRTPIHGWTEDGFRSLANYIGRIRGSTPFSKVILDSCGGHGNWKNPTECTTNLRFCDWNQKLLAFQQKGTVIWRDFSGNGGASLKEL